MYGRKEPESEPEREPENWSAHLIVAAKGGSVSIAEERDEYGDLTREAESLTGMTLARRCKEERADLWYTGAESDGGDGAEPAAATAAAADGDEALTALGWATSFKNMEVMEFLSKWDATERLIDACTEGDLGAAQRARLDGADLLALGEYERGWEAWFPVLELAERHHHGDVVTFLSETYAAASLELLDAAKVGDTKRATLARRADADLEFVDREYGYTPLMWAARKGSANMIQFLLSEGAAINASCARGGNKGTTALMEATTWSQVCIKNDELCINNDDEL